MPLENDVNHCVNSFMQRDNPRFCVTHCVNSALIDVNIINIYNSKRYKFKNQRAVNPLEV